MRKVIPLAVGVATVLAVAGCQSQRPAQTSGSARSVPAGPVASGGAATSPSTPAPASASGAAPVPATPPAVSGRANASAAAGPRPSQTTEPAGIPLASACNQDTLLSSIRRLATDMTTGVQRIKVYNCIDGYARLYAVPNLDANGSQPGGDQFFLQFSKGQWQVIIRGDAIDCGDGIPKLVQACAAFG